MSAQYEAHGGRLEAQLRYAFRGFEQDCEDVVQETFANFLRVLRDGTEEIDTPYAWLRTTARRLILNRVTSVNTFGRYVPKLTAHVVSSVPETLSGRAEIVEWRVRRRELGTTVLKALSHMTDEERPCFLAYVDGLTIKDIAEQEGLERDFASRLVHRALKKFQTCLEDADHA